MSDVSNLKLRVTVAPEKPFADRASLIGANGTGKSTLANFLIHHFRNDYGEKHRPRILVLDTKPRWRAQYLADGTNAKRRYKKMTEGDIIPGSMALERLSDWDLVWDTDVNPSQIVIVQRIDGTQAGNVVFSTIASEKFFKSQDARRPALIYFDEGMDFFHASASARGGTDIIQRCYRAGREKRLATMLGAQRPVGINLQILTEMSYCALFRINFQKDVRRLYEMGWPIGTMPPGYNDPPGTFRLWRDITGYEAPKYRLAKEVA